MPKRIKIVLTFILALLLLVIIGSICNWAYVKIKHGIGKNTHPVDSIENKK
jgi:CHASE3 domain sensor protein